MQQETNKAENTDELDAAKSTLPTLPKRNNSPFAKLASLDMKSVAAPPSLAEQAKVDPQAPAGGDEHAAEGQGTAPAPAAPKAAPAKTVRAAKAAKPEVSGETMVLQTSVPLELALAFKLHCGRLRSSVREELAKMVQAAVDKAK